jgi:hypothetical protein
VSNNPIAAARVGGIPPATSCGRYLLSGFCAFAHDGSRLFEAVGPAACLRARLWNRGLGEPEGGHPSASSGQASAQPTLRVIPNGRQVVPPAIRLQPTDSQHLPPCEAPVNSAAPTMPPGESPALRTTEHACPLHRPMSRCWRDTAVPSNSPQCSYGPVIPHCWL